MTSKTSFDQNSLVVYSQCFTPKASVKITKNLDDSPVSSISKGSSARRINLKTSASPNQRMRKKCHNSVSLLELTNTNIRVLSENSTLKTKIKEKDSENLELHLKVIKLEEQCQVKDEMIKKLSEFILNREKQFADVIQSETEKMMAMVRERDNEIERSKKRRNSRFLPKAIQVSLDLVFDEMIQEKNDEIVRLQRLVENNEYKYTHEVSYLEEQVALLEQELGKAQKYCQMFIVKDDFGEALNTKSSN